MVDKLRDAYLHLVKHAVNGDLHGAQTLMEPIGGRLASAVGRTGLVGARKHTISEATYATGTGWPPSRLNVGESMIGLARLDNLQAAVTSVIDDDVSGDLIETGVWRGGATIFMRAILAAHGIGDRTVYVADSFEGLPRTTKVPDDAAYLASDQALAVSLTAVRANFERYGLLDEQVQFIKGWFCDTLPSLKGHPWAVIRLDGDMYESTMDALVNLYPSLSPGGWIIVDDYQTYQSCRRAVDEYRRAHGITDPIARVDNDGVYWRKT